MTTKRMRFDGTGASYINDPRLTAADRARLARARVGDANTGRLGELPAGRSMGAAPTAGGVNPQEEEMFDQRRRRIRLRGRDQESGEHFGAELYLPHGGRGYGSSPASPRDAAIGDAALRNLENRDPFDECSGLRAWQRALDAHYAKG